MEKLNVLSIDFDFFQNVSEDVILNCYPDGIDLPTAITMPTWASHYANPEVEKQLLTVTPRTNEINTLKDIINSNCSKETSFMAANSHVHVYEFIKNLVKENQPEKLNIVNIDMHHDCFNDNEKVDCGNWISHIVKNFDNCSIQWIANPISKDAYGLGKKEFDFIKTDFKSIEKMKFDAVFLCRSDTWLPPHLDNYFDDFLYELVALFPNNMVEESIQEPRDMNEIIKAEKRMRTMYQRHGQLD